MEITQKELMNLFSLVGSLENSDMLLMYSPESGSTAKITAEVLRAYLNKGFEISVSDEGTLVVGGKDTGKKIECVTPQMRGGDIGIEVSYDNGETWETLVTYVSIGLNPASYQNRMESIEADVATKANKDDVASELEGKADASSLEYVAGLVSGMNDGLTDVTNALDGMKLHKPMTEEAWEGMSADESKLEAYGLYMTYEE